MLQESDGHISNCRNNSSFVTGVTEYFFIQEQIYFAFLDGIHSNAEHPLYGDHFWKNDDIESKLKEYKSKHPKLIDFIPPNKIILGWNFNMQSDNYQKIKEFSQKNSIELIKLEKSVNYIDKKFNFEVINQ